jgi:hypothetical protein
MVDYKIRFMSSGIERELTITAFSIQEAIYLLKSTYSVEKIVSITYATQNA